MATPKYRYLTPYEYFQGGNSINQVFIERILLPGLARQGSYSEAARGIELPHGDSEPEYLKLADAARLVLDWLIEHKNLRGNENNGEAKNLYDLLNRAISDKHDGSFEKFALIVRETYLARVERPRRAFSSTLSELVAEYQAAQPANTVPVAGYDPTQIIRDYNQATAEITRLMQQGYSARAAAALVPLGATAISSSLTKKALLSLIAANLARLESARLLHPGDDVDSQNLQAHAVTRELEKILDSHPELDAYRNLLGDPDIQANLRGLVKNTAEEYSSSDPKKLLAQESLHLSATLAVSDLLPDERELITRIISALKEKNIPQDDASNLARAIVGAMVKGSKAPSSSTFIVAQAIADLGVRLPPDQYRTIQSAINGNKLNLVLEYRQQELSSTFRDLTPSGRSLLSQGKNPLHLLQDPQNLRTQAATLLGVSSNSLPASDSDLYQLVENNFLALGGRDPYSYRTYRSWLNRSYTHLSLNSKEQRLASRSRIEQNLLNATSRVQSIRTKLFDRWINIEETLTGRKFINRAFDWYDKQAEKIVIPLPFTKGKIKIPIFRFAPWLFDQWHQFKQKTAIRWLKNFRGTKSGWGKFAQFNLRHYLKGGSTLNGAFFSGSREIWSKRVAKPLLVWAGQHSPAVFKYATTSLARTGTRLLIKIGGKALAKIGIKAITALATAATAIGTVVSVISLVSLVFDLLKLAYDLVKNFFTNPEFRKKMLLGGAIGSAFMALWNGIIFLPALSIIVLATLRNILLAGAIALGITAFGFFFFKAFTTMPADIDPGPAELLVAIFCDSSSNNDPTANAAICIADILTKAGLNPLFAGSVNSSPWQQIVAQLASDTVKAIAKSAIGQDWFQCVGLVAAAIAESGGGYWEPPNAKDLVNINPPGYDFVAGAGSCQAGDIFVDTHGTWGHTGVVIDPNAGAFVTCVDANYSGPGAIRNQDSCRYPKSLIAGCLKKR